MSKYREAIQNGVLVRQKRKLVRFWIWSFNRSEEDYLTKLKNQLVSAKGNMRKLQRTIPKVEQKLAERKKLVAEMGGHTHFWTDSWSLRRDPKILAEPSGKPKPKETAKRKHPNEGVIAKLVTSK